MSRKLIQSLILSILAILLSAHVLPGGEPAVEEIFIRGNIAYGNAAYAQAEESYRQVLKSAQSSEVHYNLGNALAQQDKWSEAAYHYLRAYSLDPNSESTQANLLLAAERLGLDSGYPRLHSPANLMPEYLWVLIASVAFWSAIILFFQRDLLNLEMPLRKTTSLLAFVVFLIGGLAALQHSLFDEWTVVSLPEVSLRVAPAEQSPGDATLVEGDPIRLLARQNGFFHVMNAMGEEGFLMKEEVYLPGND